eukprot:gnl/TRDRNA2_/TRDRNA2_190090_c0_seq1.p1 gnl/TRDRNA2_/TRDRNA2_190090_c0~~gnl/TRDRNA2_/TRDRNA2_190090_c0_seq1.p1  ORF type:complete len:232 (-),score=64.95 gnl/TRDRNA2_/TRDRNA2_190090_c0_seq1:96-719(-)
MGEEDLALRDDDEDLGVDDGQKETFDFWPYCSSEKIIEVQWGKQGKVSKQKFADALARVKKRYANLKPEFDDDDMIGMLTEEERAKGWQYPLTRTQQKKMFGCVVISQERFMNHLREGNLLVVEEYLKDAKKKEAINVNRFDATGRAPIHYAAKLKDARIMTALLSAGADVQLETQDTGATAAALAMEKDQFGDVNQAVIDVLKSGD